MHALNLDGHGSSPSPNATPVVGAVPKVCPWILVVDDDIEICRLNADILTHFGYHVDMANSGAMAWRKIQEKPYDLIITDYFMPGYTGLDLFNQLKANNIRTPIILATGSVPDDELESVLAQMTVLLKPFSFDKLLQAVKTALGQTA